MSAEAVKRWRLKTKQRMVDAFGSKCCVCRYDKSIQALHFHHVNPEEKSFGLASSKANPKSWEQIVSELRKCVLVCNNCHSEIHAGITEIPSDAPRFDESYAEYELERFREVDNCPVCGTEKPKAQITCSYECAGKRQGKVDWDNVDLLGLKNTGMSNMAIAHKFDCSEAAVRKRLKKITF